MATEDTVPVPPEERRGMLEHKSIWPETPENVNGDTAFPEKELIVEEYKSLREEIHTHINVQYTTLGFTFVFVGTIVTISVQGQISPLALMIYPILTLFPALIWVANQVAIKGIARFLREQFEPRLHSELRWEEWVSKQTNDQTWSWVNRTYIWGIRGIYIGSQVIVLSLAIFIFISQYEKYKTWLPLAIAEVIVSVVAVLVMCWILMEGNK